MVLRYAIMGALSTVLYSVVLVILIEILYVDPFISSLSAYLATLVSSFYVAHHWVFSSKEVHGKTFYKYFMVSMFGFLINISGFYVLVSVLGFWYIYAQLFLFILVAGNNFLLNRYWSFRT